MESLNNLLNHSLTEENWWDVPFHYIISSDGTIYEGRSSRYAGDTNSGYDPRGVLQIGLTRTEESGSPTEEQLDAVGRLASAQILKYNLTVRDFHTFTDEPGVALSTRAERRNQHRTIVRLIETRLEK